MTQPTPKHEKEARKPERIWIHGPTLGNLNTFPCGIAGCKDEFEYVPAALLSFRDTQIREVLEGLRGVKGNPQCWCNPMYPNIPSSHDAACLAAQGLWERVQDSHSSSGP